MLDETFDKLLRIRDGFRSDTCHPKWDFDPDLPASGQCGAAAVASQILYPKVEIYKGNVSRRRHYICKLDDMWFDLTADQFNTTVRQSPGKPYAGYWELCSIKDPDTINRAKLILHYAGLK